MHSMGVLLSGGGHGTTMALGYAWFDSYDSVGYVLTLHIFSPYNLPYKLRYGEVWGAFSSASRVLRGGLTLNPNPSNLQIALSERARAHANHSRRLELCASERASAHACIPTDRPSIQQPPRAGPRRKLER